MPGRGKNASERSVDVVLKKSEAVEKKKVTRHLKTVVQAPGKLIDRVNQELYKRNAELAVRNKTLALLRKLDEISLAAVTLEEMAQKMTTEIATELGYDLVSIAIVEEEEKIVHWLAIASAMPWISEVLEGDRTKDLRAPVQDGLRSTGVLQSNEPVFLDDLHEVFPNDFVQVLIENNTTKGIEPLQYSMVYPLRFGDKVLGMLTFSSSRSLKNLSRYEQESVGGIIGLVALALYKSKIYTDLQRTSAELAAANVQLKDLDKAKSEFLSIASHQLYTPLTALRGYLSMMLEGDFGTISEQQKPIIDILQDSTNRLIELIKNLLDISRIESGRLELKLESIDLAAMAKSLVGELLPNARAKKLDLALEKPDPALPHVVGDTQRLRQVMLNFVDNAIKYTPQGFVHVSLQKEGDKILFSVTDSGKGLLPEEIVKLFNKFTRVGGASRFHTEGVGLGLYVAKQIVKEHHGDIEVKSPGLNKGSTFSLYLPIEGSANSLKIGEKATVVIKAAEATGTGTPEAV